MLKPLLKTLLVLACGLLLTNCDTSSDDFVNPSDSEVLSAVLEIAEDNSVNRQDINWPDTRQAVQSSFTNEGYEAAIRTLLRALGDNHSFYNTVNGSAYTERTNSCTTQGYDLSALPNDIAYLRVNSFLFNANGTAPANFAGDMQNTLRIQERTNPKGWVIDLSLTSGGNMYPLIGGLGPFFSDIVLGHFIDPLQNEAPWGYEVGSVFHSSPRITALQINNPLVLDDPEVKVVIVTDQATASSGEAVALSFKGRPNTLFLGRPTCGLSTGTRVFGLPNGDQFILAVADMADRDKNVYGGIIQPDEQIGSDQEMVDRIVEWMNE